MNQLVYEKNLAALEQKYPVWAEIVRSKRRKKRNFDVVIEKSYTDESIMKVVDHQKCYYLNGKYAPTAPVEEWLVSQGDMDKFATIIIVGISNGVHIKRIMESVPKTVNIMIYEPSFEIFRRAMEEVDLSFIFQLDIPVGIVVQEINGFEVERYFRYFVTYDNMIFLKIYMSGNYQNLFPEQVGTFIENLKKYINNIEVGWNTTIRYTNVNAQNVFHNLCYLYEGASVSELKGMLPEDVPVIVVSAGPSLNKNIQDLKAAVGKACIIATDTAMKPLLNAGIVPDLFMIVDGLKPAELFEHKDISKVGMVTMTAVSTEPMDIHKGRKFFYYSNSPYETELIRNVAAMDEREICLPDIPTGGSVATSAYSLGVYMGAKTVILVGQDLALTGNKAHVDGAFENEICEIDMSTGIYSEVEAVDGGKVITRNDFKLYLDWFEMIVKAWDHIQIVDATEGGALIHGSKVMTLKKAIKKYCTKNFNAKWHIARVPRIFRTCEEKEYAIGYFENIGERLVQVEKKANEGAEYYEKLLKLTKRSSVNPDKLKKIYRKIQKVNTFMEDDAVAETVIDSLKGLEYTLRPLIYQVKEDEKDDINEVAVQGKLMMTAISIGAKELGQIAEETMIPYAKEAKVNLTMYKNEKGNDYGDE